MPHWARIVIALALLGCAGPSNAVFHLWQIVEVYSNYDGSVQFIELLGQADNQHLVEGHTMVAVSDGETRSMTFPHNLPVSTTNNRRLLLATPGFADLPGAVAPDFEIPARFFDPNAATIHLDFAEGSDTFEFSCSDLPIDGLLSLLRNLGTDTNSPENFSGTTGELEPGTVFADRFEIGCGVE